MSCSNCYNGCTDIISDKCVKYTGVSVPELGIETGDSLSFVEQALIEFLTATMDGTGIIPTLTTPICDLVHDYLPTCADITMTDVVNALIKSACDIQEQIDAIVATLTELDNDYDVDCLLGVTNASNTHPIVQAIITKLCAMDTTLTNLIASLPSTYVALNNLNALIDDHLADTSSLMSNKMVPWTAVEYYGSLTYFDTTGAGEGDWLNIYLCNGNNGTPDKRGRIPVGTTTGMGGPNFDDRVNPSITGNPSYSLYTDNIGTNTVTLTSSQMANHTHIATVTIIDPTHTHGWTGTVGTGWPNGAHDSTSAGTADSYPRTSQNNSVATGLNDTNVTVTNTSTGGNLSHSNIQPVLACHYVIYIP